MLIWCHWLWSRYSLRGDSSRCLILYLVRWGMLHELWSRGMSRESCKFWLEDQPVLHVLVCSTNEHSRISAVLIQIYVIWVRLLFIFTISLIFTLWFLIFRIVAYKNFFWGFSAARRSRWPKYPQYWIVPKDILEPSCENCKKWSWIDVFYDIAIFIAEKIKHERVESLVRDLEWYCAKNEPHVTHRFIACFYLFLYSSYS